MKLKVMNDVVPWIDKCCLIAVLLEIIMFVLNMILRYIRKEFRMEIFKELEDVLDYV